MPAVTITTTLAELARLDGLNAVVDVIDEPVRVPGGVLDGVPVAIKNIVDVQGVPTRMGAPATAGIAQSDAALVARLRAAGALIVATTQCLEWAAGFAHPAVGDTRNPLDPELTAGGSSGGSAAVVAAGAVPLAVGTDTGGSIRIPAAYCGIAGIKATTGAIALDGVQALSPSLDCAGLFAPTARSLWPGLAVLVGDEPVALPVRAPAGVTLGVLEDQFADASVISPERFETAIAALAAGGIELRPIGGGWTARAGELLDALTVIVGYEAAGVHWDRDTSGDAPGTRALLEYGTTVSASEYRSALSCRSALAGEIDESLCGTDGTGGVDALIGPTVGYPAPPENPPFGADDDTEARFSGPYNLSGHPALSVPCDRLLMPLGLQLAGRRGDDAGLVAVADAVERVIADRQRVTR